MVIYFNQQKFNKDAYGEDSIERFSMGSRSDFSVEFPGYVVQNVQMNKVADESDFIQLGQAKYDDFTSIQVDK